MLTALTKCCHFLYQYHLEFFLFNVFAVIVFTVPFALMQRKKLFFILLFTLPVLTEGTYTAMVYGAWCYRMELRDTYGRHPMGWTDISLMNKEKRAEYAKYSYHPRHRNVIGGMVRLCVFTPVIYLAGSLFYMTVFFFKSFFLKYICKKE